jgi:hypothetical protein
MTKKKTEKALATLDELKRSFGAGDARLLEALSMLSQAQFTESDSLIRFHETLLFMRAYPASTRVLKLTDNVLKTFGQRVLRLADTDADLSALDDPEISGVAGRSVTSNFSYAIIRWLIKSFPRQLSIDWDWFEEEDRFGATMPRFVPLLEDDALVEAHVPFRQWLDAARGRENELAWLMRQFESLQIPEKRKAETYDALKLHVTWRFGAEVSRTLMRRPMRKAFVHEQPLIQRREISLLRELVSPAIPIERLSPAAGEKILNLARATSAVRYRELHGFTFGDPRGVLRADLGRGTEAFVTGVTPENRLPLRAYHAALIFKNGVPVAYFEGLSLCERMESGFNLYYTFRDGETAWLYSRTLRLMKQLLGVTVFSIDPYQVGHENEEGIESGAFWFYRKLGFRPVKPELLALTESEERKMSEDSRHRTSARTLRKLAAGPMIFELPGHPRAGGWDNFEARRIGLAVQRRMAREFKGNSAAIRDYSRQYVERALQIDSASWNADEKVALQNLSLTLAMIPNLARWSTGEKALAVRILRAKAGAEEALYLKLMQKHAALGDVLTKIGSG